jgi:hypothetical protein
MSEEEATETTSPVKRKHDGQEEEENVETAAKVTRRTPKHEDDKSITLYEAYIDGGQGEWVRQGLSEVDALLCVTIPASCVLNVKENSRVKVYEEEDSMLTRYTRSETKCSVQPTSIYYMCLPGVLPLSSKHMSHPWGVTPDPNGYSDYLTFIQTVGTFSPAGHSISTPEKIKVSLKPHQQRSLYEMRLRESYPELISPMNTFVFSERIGSGKSLTLLSLIAEAPIIDVNSHSEMTTKNVTTHDRANPSWVAFKHDTRFEVKSSLIVVPHAIYLQWLYYIRTQTALTVLPIGTQRSIVSLGKTKEAILEQLNSVDIVLLKATMTKNFFSGIGEVDAELVPKEVRAHGASAFYHMLPYLTPGAREQAEKLFPLIPDPYVFPSQKHDGSLVQDDYVFASDTFASRRLCDVEELSEHIERHFKQMRSHVQRLRMGRYGGIASDFTENQTFVRLLSNMGRLYSDLAAATDMTTPIGLIPPKGRVFGTGLVFQRVIIDEADTIHIPSCPTMLGKVTWLVSASLSNLLVPGGGYIFNGSKKQLLVGIASKSGMIRDRLSLLFKDPLVYRALRSTFLGCIVKNHSKYVDDCLALPVPTYIFTKCATPRVITELFRVLGADDIGDRMQRLVFASLNAGDSTSAAALLRSRIAELEESQQLRDHRIHGILSTDGDDDDDDEDDDEDLEEYPPELRAALDKQRQQQQEQEQQHQQKQSGGGAEAAAVPVVETMDNVVELAKLLIEKTIQNNRTKILFNETKIAKYNYRIKVIEEKLLAGGMSQEQSAQLRSKSRAATARIKKLHLAINELKLATSRLEYNAKVVAQRSSEMVGKADDDCPLCFDSMETDECRILMTCCLKIICSECKACLLDHDHLECSFCRAPSALKHSVPFSSFSAKENDEDENTAVSAEAASAVNKLRTEAAAAAIERTGPVYPTKLVYLIETIRKSPGKRILIFAQFTSMFSIIQKKLEKYNIPCSALKGSPAHIMNVLTKYRAGHCPVLLLSANHFGAGINLVETDIIFLYHRMDKALEEQVIGRAYRLGATHSVQVNRLCYENEYEAFDAPVTTAQMEKEEMEEDTLSDL